MSNAACALIAGDSIHAQLCQATAGQHHRFERGLGYVLGDTLSRDRYAGLLAALFGFYVPLEDHLSQWEGTSTLLALPLIRRAGLLERDLRAFGLAPDQVPRCVEMPTLTSIDHAAGAIYVVEGACLGGYALCAVTDTGPGLAPEQMKEVFNRYWQASKTGREGAGLGLYIAKGVVEAHGGRIWAERAEEGGAAFKFTLPLTHSTPAA